MSEFMVQMPAPRNRTFYFYQDVTVESVCDLTRMILEVNKHDDYLVRLGEVNQLIYQPAAIEIFIDSPGGNVYPALGLIDVMAQSRTRIHTIVTGKAMSAALLITACGHKRMAHKHSTFMFHQLSTGTFGNLEDINESVREFNRMQEQLDNIILERTKLTKTILDENRERRSDWYMTSQEALANGIIDQIVGVN